MDSVVLRLHENGHYRSEADMAEIKFMSTPALSRNAS
jgi:hypothetical protein